VRDNITKRWALTEMTSVQRAIVSLLREQSLTNAPKLSQIEELNLMNELNDFGTESVVSKSDHVKKLLGQEFSKHSFSGSDAHKEIETHAGYQPPSDEFQLVLHKLREQVQSEQDFYIQARDNTGKLTAVLSIVADDLLAREPELAPEIKERPDIMVYKKFAERERAHPRVLIITNEEKDAVHANRLAERSFARSNASVQVVRYDSEAEDFLHKAFTLGANVLTMDHRCFQQMVQRGWISARDLKYLIVDDVQAIANEIGGVDTIFEGIMQKSSFLGPATKRIAIATNDADHTHRARQFFLRDGYISILANDLNASDVDVVYVEAQQAGEQLRAASNSSIVVTSDKQDAQNLLQEFERHGIHNASLVENKEQIESKLTAFEQGDISSLIVPQNLTHEFKSTFSFQVPVYFYNFLDLNVGANLAQLNNRSQNLRLLVTESIPARKIMALKKYCDVIDKDLDKNVFRLYLNAFNNTNLIKNLRVNDFVDARQMVLEARHPENGWFDVSILEQYVYDNHKDIVNTRAIETERAKRMTELRKKATSKVSKTFRKSAPFREFFKLNLLNDIDRQQRAFIENTILSKENFTVGEILEALSTFGIEWSSPATLLQRTLENLRLSLQRSQASLEVSALKEFSKMRPQSRLVRHINDHVLSTIERYQVLGNVASQFMGQVQDPKIIQALASLPSSSKDFSQWYDKLHDDVVIQLNDLSDVLILMEEGISIPSVQPEQSETTVQIEHLLEEVRNSPDYVSEWTDFNEQVIEEIQKRFNVSDAAASQDMKEREKYRQIIFSIHEQLVFEYPLMAQERELEEALVVSEFAPHYTDDY